MPKLKIGVFDSGVGGLSVAQTIQAALPDAEVLFTDDHEHLPYGTKPPAKLLGYVLPILNMLSEQGCQVIVVACNTVSTTLIKELRAKLDVPLIAMEPMVKPAAALTKSGVVAVCATPTTLASQRYAWLKSEYAKGLKVVEPDCSDWTSMIEENRVDRNQVTDRIDAACQQGADVIVLGCTHYHWIQDLIEQVVAGRAVVVQPEQAIVKEVKRQSKLLRLL